MPVDYVADAMDHIIHEPGLDGRAFHLVNPKPQPVHHGVQRVRQGRRRAPARRRTGPDRPAVLGPAPALAGLLGRVPGVDLVRDVTLDQLQLPLEALPHVAFTSTFDDSGTQAALEGTGIAAPAAAAVRRRSLWRYWEEHLDRDRARRPRPGGPLAGRRVVITGASSGIGRAAALQVAQPRGRAAARGPARPRRSRRCRPRSSSAGGQAWVYSCDLTDDESVDTLVKQLLADHEASTCS